MHCPSIRLGGPSRSVPFRPLMTHASAGRQRRAQESVGKKILLAVRRLPRDRSASPPRAPASGCSTSPLARPSIDTLKPADSGANSQVFAADGTSLGYVQTDDPARRRSSSTRSRRACSRRRSRSRTRTSTSTAASTTARSSAPRSRTPRPARSSRAPRRSPSSSSATSTSRTPRTRSSARSSRRRWRGSTRRSTRRTRSSSST